MKVGDTVHYTDAANVRGTCWDMTGPVVIVRLPTKRDARYIVRRMYCRDRRFADARQLRPINNATQ